MNEIETIPFGLDKDKFYIEKVIGFAIEYTEFSQRIHENDENMSPKSIIVAYPIIFRDDNYLPPDLNGHFENICGVVPATDCYKVLGLNENTKEYESLGYICGKATQLDWEKERQKMIKRSKERMKK